GSSTIGEPRQEKLVTTAEEPIDISPPPRDEEELADLGLLDGAERGDLAQADGQDTGGFSPTAPAEAAEMAAPFRGDGAADEDNGQQQTVTHLHPKNEDRIEQILRDSEDELKG